MHHMVSEGRNPDSFVTFVVHEPELAFGQEVDSFEGRNG